MSVLLLGDSCQSETDTSGLSVRGLSCLNDRLGASRLCADVVSLTARGLRGFRVSGLEVGVWGFECKVAWQVVGVQTGEDFSEQGRGLGLLREVRV